MEVDASVNAVENFTATAVASPVVPMEVDEPAITVVAADQAPAITNTLSPVTEKKSIVPPEDDDMNESVADEVSGADTVELPAAAHDASNEVQCSEGEAATGGIGATVEVVTKPDSATPPPPLLPPAPPPNESEPIKVAGDLSEIAAVVAIAAESSQNDKVDVSTTHESASGKDDTPVSETNKETPAEVTEVDASVVASSKTTVDETVKVEITKEKDRDRDREGELEQQPEQMVNVEPEGEIKSPAYEIILLNDDDDDDDDDGGGGENDDDEDDGDDNEEDENNGDGNGNDIDDDREENGADDADEVDDGEEDGRHGIESQFDDEVEEEEELATAETVHNIIDDDDDDDEDDEDDDDEEDEDDEDDDDNNDEEVEEEEEINEEEDDELDGEEDVDDEHDDMEVKRDNGTNEMQINKKKDQQQHPPQQHQAEANEAATITPFELDDHEKDAIRIPRQQCNMALMLKKRSIKWLNRRMHGMGMGDTVMMVESDRATASKEADTPQKNAELVLPSAEKVDSAVPTTSLISTTKTITTTTTTATSSTFTTTPTSTATSTATVMTTATLLTAAIAPAATTAAAAKEVTAEKTGACKSNATVTPTITATAIGGIGVASPQLELLSPSSKETKPVEISVTAETKECLADDNNKKMTDDGIANGGDDKRTKHELNESIAVAIKKEDLDEQDDEQEDDEEDDEHEHDEADEDEEEEQELEHEPIEPQSLIESEAVDLTSSPESSTSVVNFDISELSTVNGGDGDADRSGPGNSNSNNKNAIRKCKTINCETVRDKKSEEQQKTQLKASGDGGVANATAESAATAAVVVVVVDEDHEMDTTVQNKTSKHGDQEEPLSLEMRRVAGPVTKKRTAESEPSTAKRKRRVSSSPSSSCATPNPNQLIECVDKGDQRIDTTTTTPTIATVSANTIPAFVTTTTGAVSTTINNSMNTATTTTTTTTSMPPSKRLCTELQSNFTTHDNLLADYIDQTANTTTDEIQRHVDQLITEIQTLNDMLRAKEMEWNTMLHLKKVKEEIVVRLNRRRQVLEITSTALPATVNDERMPGTGVAGIVSLASANASAGVSSTLSGGKLKQSGDLGLPITMVPVVSSTPTTAITAINNNSTHSILQSRANMKSADLAKEKHNTNKLHRLLFRNILPKSHQSASGGGVSVGVSGTTAVNTVAAAAAAQTVTSASSSGHSVSAHHSLGAGTFGTHPSSLGGFVASAELLINGHNHHQQQQQQQQQQFHHLHHMTSAQVASAQSQTAAAMGRQGAIKDVKSIIADYRQRHPETVPRRGRRMKGAPVGSDGDTMMGVQSSRNARNDARMSELGLLLTGLEGNSRPSSADSSHSNSNTATSVGQSSSAGNAANTNSGGTITNLSFKDVLAQFAKMSPSDRKMISTAPGWKERFFAVQSAGSALNSNNGANNGGGNGGNSGNSKPPPPYPEVTLHPVGTQAENSGTGHTNSLLHGILTKSATRPNNASGFTSFSPTLARLLTAPERITANAAAAVSQTVYQPSPQVAAAAAAAGINLSKSHSEITITPVVTPPSVQQQQQQQQAVAAAAALLHHHQQQQQLQQQQEQQQHHHHQQQQQQQQHHHHHQQQQQQQHHQQHHQHRQRDDTASNRMKQDSFLTLDDEQDDSVDRLVIDESGDSGTEQHHQASISNAVGQEFHENEVPECQGCKKREAQFVCAGCGNQWYCSRDCQVTAWDEHSEVCTG